MIYGARTNGNANRAENDGHDCDESEDLVLVRVAVDVVVLQEH